jgi:C-terminal processing protease CtpA/Prc
LPDDIILTIDGQPTSSYSIADIRQMFMIEGKIARLEIERAGETLNFELKLRRLI